MGRRLRLPTAVFRGWMKGKALANLRAESTDSRSRFMKVSQAPLWLVMITGFDLGQADDAQNMPE
jgi:hypothetical protein